MERRGFITYVSTPGDGDAPGRPAPDGIDAPGARDARAVARAPSRSDGPASNPAGAAPRATGSPGPGRSRASEEPLPDRQCARPLCREAAGATLTYDYSARTVWIDRLAPERHPLAHDLCVEHAGRLRVPNGWEREDRRGAHLGVAPPLAG